MSLKVETWFSIFATSLSRGQWEREREREREAKTESHAQTALLYGAETAGRGVGGAKRVLSWSYNSQRPHKIGRWCVALARRLSLLLLLWGSWSSLEVNEHTLRLRFRSARPTSRPWPWARLLAALPKKKKNHTKIKQTFFSSFSQFSFFLFIIQRDPKTRT